MTRVLGMAVLALGLMASAACAAHQAPQTQPPRPASSAAAKITTEAQVLDTPFNRIFESQRQLATERDAYERLMSQCTRRAGEAFVPPDSYNPLVMLYDFAMPFGPVSVARTLRYGYHDPVFREGPQAPAWRGEVTPAEVSGLPRADSSAPASGCDAKVVEALGGPRPQAALSRAAAARDDAVADQRWKAAGQAWRDCMRDHGYSYQAPLDALDGFINRGGPPQQAEIAVASTDARCKATSGYIDTVVGLLRTYEEKALTGHRSEFDEYSQWKSAYLARAEHVVETVPPPSNRFWETPEGPTATDPSDLGG